MVASRSLPRTEIALIVEVYPICNRIETVFGAESLHHGKQFVLAVETSLRVVASIVGVGEFPSLDNL